MPRTRLLPVLLLAALACSKSGSSDGTPSGGVAGTYSAANGDPLSFTFKSGGKVTMDGGPLGTASGSYTVEGEKLVVTMPGALPSTFIKDGNCIEDQLHMFGKLCIGGQAGAQANVSTRSAPATTGVWVATNADGVFRLEFKTGNTLVITLTPPGGQPAPKNGTYRVEGDEIYATLDPAEPMVLKFVNGNYESTSFGLPMKFVKQ